ncbi:hypothetical protein AB0B10_26105 [Micromonospora arborensis]|uniref:hypothetical protein n=1 Tax=Micromonospora arborensis TaxID=2116518 RepID=UPI0033C95DA7
MPTSRTTAGIRPAVLRSRHPHPARDADPLVTAETDAAMVLAHLDGPARTGRKEPLPASEVPEIAHLYANNVTPERIIALPRKASTR